MNFRLSLLGSFALAVEGKPLKFPSRRESSLFAYLTLHQESGGIRRERLAGLLWPDVDEQRARRSLSTALWRIKVTLGREAASLAPQTSGAVVEIKLDPEAVDALKFQWLLETAELHPQADRLPMLREAESLYGGDLLDEYEDEWCDETRRYLRGQYANVLRQLSSIHTNQGQYTTAVQFARKLVAVEPLDEEGHRELVLLYHLAGDRGAALSQYETLRNSLRLELGVEPNESTTQLWEYIRTSAPDTHMISQPTPRNYAISTNLGIPLIGREQYVSTVLDRVREAIEGRGSAVLLSGEAGIGKTKLAETVVSEVSLRNVQVLQGRCPDLQSPPPYQVIFQALWPRAMEAMRSESPGSPLGAILRALSFESAPTKRTARNLEPTLNTTIVMEAILGLIESQSAKRPTLLILEDIHRIDQASLTLLATLLDRVPSMPVVVLATIRSDERKSDEITSTLTANGALHVSLPPLNEIELHRLVRAILRDKSVSQEVLTFIWDRTDGVPLFALELVDFMVAEGHLHKTKSGIWELRDQASKIPDRFPSRVNEVIRRRIDSLDRQSRKALVTAAVVGMEFSLKHVAALTGLSEDTIADSLNRLVDYRLVVELEEHFRFRHETIRAVALDLPTVAKRRILHLRAGGILEKSGTSQPEDLYIHFLEADKRDKALIYAEASGDKARGVHANANAVTWYTKAIELLDSIDSSSKDRFRKKILLLIKRHEILEVLGDPGRLDHINSIHDLASRLEDKGLLARVQYLRARIIARSSAHEEALGAATLARKLYRGIADLRGEAAATEMLGEIYLYLRDYDRAKGILDQAIDLYRHAGDQVGEARALVTGSMVLTHENNRKTLASLERAETLLNGSEELQIRAGLLFQKGICYRLLGRAKMSDSSLRTGLELTRRIGDRVLEARARSQLAATLSVLGRHAEAIREARHGLRLARQTNDKRALITGLNNAAYGAYRLSGALKHAKSAAMTAVRMIESTTPHENPVMYEDTLATVLLEQGDTESALQVALQAKTHCSHGGLRAMKGDVYHHLGTIYLQRKEYDRAILYLQKAIRIYRASDDLIDQSLATASLILAFIEEGETRLAATHANRISRMMREVEGIDQVQLILWSQYRAFLATRRPTEARRALNKAYDAVLSQAGSLKGRNRHRFLSDLGINRIILAEAAQVRLDKENQITSMTDSSAWTTTGSN